jgi:hypothetical protein
VGLVELLPAVEEVCTAWAALVAANQERPVLPGDLLESFSLFLEVCQQRTLDQFSPRVGCLEQNSSPSGRLALVGVGEVPEILMLSSESMGDTKDDYHEARARMHVLSVEALLGQELLCGCGISITAALTAGGGLDKAEAVLGSVLSTLEPATRRSLVLTDVDSLSAAARLTAYAATLCLEKMHYRDHWGALVEARLAAECARDIVRTKSMRTVAVALVLLAICNEPSQTLDSCRIRTLLQQVSPYRN